MSEQCLKTPWPPHAWQLFPWCLMLNKWGSETACSGSLGQELFLLLFFLVLHSVLGSSQSLGPDHRLGV